MEHAPNTQPPITTRCITTLAGLHEIAPQWHDLAQRDGRGMGYFQSVDWCLAWCHAHLPGMKADDTLRVQAFYRGDELVALLPLMIEAKHGLRRLVVLGFPDSQYADCLMDPAAMKGEELADALDTLGRDDGIDCISFDDIPEGSPLLAALGDRGQSFHLKEETMVMDLSRFSTGEEFEASLPKRMRKNRRVRVRKLEEQGEMTLDVLLAGSDEYRDLLPTAMEWKRGWLEAQGHPISEEREQRWHTMLAGLHGRRTTDPAFGQGSAMTVLRMDGVPIALEIGFFKEHHYYSYLGAYDAEWSQHSPGKVQMHRTMMWAVEQGVQTYDLLGASDYKAPNSNATIPLHSRVLPLSWKGNLFAKLWLPHLRPRLYKTFSAMGPQAKSHIVRVRSLLDPGSRKADGDTPPLAAAPPLVPGMDDVAGELPRRRLHERLEDEKMRA